MHKSLEKFAEYEEKKLVRKVVSPCGKLVLWNYTDHCTYEKAWDEVTLNARGTVYEMATGKVVARSFPKFFNYGELEGIDPEKQQEVLNSTDFEVFEKMDGSLGIVYYYDGEWRVNTRGSFTSDQAIKGKEILEDFDTDFLMERCTYLVEIIYPENKIIVDYGQEEKLVCLAAFNVDPDREEEEVHPMFIGMDFTPSSKFNTIEELQTHLATLDHTEEGYVVRLGNGYRVKFKSAEYLRVARIINHMSPLAFWEKLENGTIDREFLEALPEEFRDECDKIADTLERQYCRMWSRILQDHSRIMKPIYKGNPLCLTDSELSEMRKDLGIYLKQNKEEHSAVFFPMLLGNDKAVENYVKKVIKPVGNVMKEI